LKTVGTAYLKHYHTYIITE
jgi:hypothetical protein